MTAPANYLQVPLATGFAIDITVWRDIKALDKEAGFCVYAITEVALGVLLVAEVIELIARSVFLLLASPLYLLGASARANYARFASGFVGTVLMTLFTIQALYHNLFSSHSGVNSLGFTLRLFGLITDEELRYGHAWVDVAYKQGKEIAEMKKMFSKIRANITDELMMKELPELLGLAGIIKNSPN